MISGIQAEQRRCAHRRPSVGLSADKRSKSAGVFLVLSFEVSAEVLRGHKRQRGSWRHRSAGQSCHHDHGLSAGAHLSKFAMRVVFRKVERVSTHEVIVLELHV